MNSPNHIINGEVTQIPEFNHINEKIMQVHELNHIDFLLRSPSCIFSQV